MLCLELVEVTVVASVCLERIAGDDKRLCGIQEVDAQDEALRSPSILWESEVVEV